MKFKQALKLTVLTTAILASFCGGSNQVKAQVASNFEEKMINQQDFVAVARPLGPYRYDLIVIGQIPGQRSCWSESGSSPTYVEFLLNQFDFTGSCLRSTDSNGYSIRKGSQDYGLDYLLQLVERNGELVLVARHRSVSNRPEIVVGRTKALPSGEKPVKIFLDPGWQFTRRAYQGRTLGHIYFSNSQ